MAKGAKESIVDTDCNELAEQVRLHRIKEATLARYPDCRDPDHPGCEDCSDLTDEDQDDDLSFES
jgi:hypothetical protein